MVSKLKSAEKELISLKKKQAGYESKLESVAAQRAAILAAIESGDDINLEESTGQIIELDGKAEILKAAIKAAKQQESMAAGVVDRLQRDDAEIQFNKRLAAINAKVADIAALADSIDQLRVDIIPDYEAMESLAGQYFSGGKYNKMRSPYRGRIMSARNAVVEFGQFANYIRGTARPFTNGNK